MNVISAKIDLAAKGAPNLDFLPWVKGTPQNKITSELRAPADLFLPDPDPDLDSGARYVGDGDRGSVANVPGDSQGPDAADFVGDLKAAREVM